MLKDAREFGQAATVLFALNYAVVTHFLCANFTTAKAMADELFARWRTERRFVLEARRRAIPRLALFGCGWEPKRQFNCLPPASPYFA